MRNYRSIEKLQNQAENTGTNRYHEIEFHVYNNVVLPANKLLILRKKTIQANEKKEDQSNWSNKNDIDIILIPQIFNFIIFDMNILLVLVRFFYMIFNVQDYENE